MTVFWLYRKLILTFLIIILYIRIKKKGYMQIVKAIHQGFLGRVNKCLKVNEHALEEVIYNNFFSKSFMMSFCYRGFC